MGSNMDGVCTECGEILSDVSQNICSDCCSYEMIQGRVWADNPDRAAELIREKHGEFTGKLTIRECAPDYLLPRWFEYYLRREGANDA